MVWESSSSSHEQTFCPAGTFGFPRSLLPLVRGQRDLLPFPHSKTLPTLSQFPTAAHLTPFLDEESPFQDLAPHHFPPLHLGVTRTKVRFLWVDFSQIMNLQRPRKGPALVSLPDLAAQGCP